MPFLMAFFLMNVQASSTWKIETVDYGPNTVGMWTSIALDSNDNPHIAYYSLQDQCLKYARWTGSTWIKETVDNPYARNVGQFASIAVDSNDNPHISYLDFAYTYKLKYASWDGSAWSIQVVDGSTNHCGEFCCLALDSTDNPHISYLYQGRTRDVRYAKLMGSEWSIETADSPGTYEGGGGEYISLALDSTDNPHISYLGASLDSTAGGDLRYARWTGSEWIVEIADAIGYTGYYTSLALDSSDNPHISHYNAVNLDLKYTWWSGSEWITETVDSTGNVGRWGSLALDSSDNPHISYHDFTNQDLKYARWTGSTWSLETVDSTDRVGRWGSLALDSSDNPHISYHKDTNGDLKYATTKGGNVPPVLGAIGPQTANELVPLDFTATATDDDVPAQTLTFSLADGVSGSVPSGASITSDGYFTWTPSEAQGPGSYTFDVVVSDGVDTDSETVTVTVNEVNVAPVLDPISEYYVYWDEELTFTATANDADSPANTLTFSLIGAPSGASITSGGYFAWTPSSSQIDEYTFTVRVEDDGSPLMYDEQQVTIEIGKHPTQLVYSGDSSGQYSDPATITATLTDTVTGSGVESKTITFTVGSQWTTATTTGTGVATTSVTLTQPAGSYIVVSEFAGDSLYLGTSDSVPFTIGKESVTIDYTGDITVWTAGPTITTAPVRLSATLTQDDGYLGDLTLAKVTFMIETVGPGGSTSVTNVPVDSLGEVLATINVDADVYIVRVFIESNPYWVYDEDGASLTVVTSTGKQTVTGGGWIEDELSINGKGTFGFTVNYNKKGAAKGSFVYVYRTEEYIYRIKSNSWQGGGLSFSGNNKAFFTGKCTIQQIDRETGETVDSEGNSQFLVDITDGDLGSPQKLHDDTIASTFLLNDGSTWRQIGTYANPIPLGNGNIVIHK